MKPKRAFDHKNYTYKDGTFYLKNELSFLNTGDFVRKLDKFINHISQKSVSIDLSALKKIDSAGTTAIYYLCEQLEKRDIKTEITGASELLKEKLELFKPATAELPLKPTEDSIFYKIGDLLWRFITKYGKDYLLLLADITYWSVSDLFNSQNRRKDETVNQAVAIGVNALPIVIVLTFIIGLVLSIHSAIQLRNFGADVFIVDLVVISMMAQMGPLITAILVAGRSGSAIAAEIATMKVTSETDALTTMGLTPLRFVVIPKIYGGIITMPFLTMMANMAGIAGGALIAYTYLDVNLEVFINRMDGVLYYKDILTGVLKSIVYVVIIIVTGSYFGMNVEEGAEGVGKSTTKSVVASISLVIVADLIMGLIFY